MSSVSSRLNIALYSGDPSSSQYSVASGASKLIGISRQRLGRTMKCRVSGCRMMLYIIVPFLKRFLRI